MELGNIVSNFMGMDGRINRQPWWIGMIVLGIVQAIVTWIVSLIIPGGAISIGADGTIDPNAITGLLQRSGWIGLVIALVFAYPFLSMAVKRRHDKNNNGYDAYGFVVVEVLYYIVMGLGLTLGIVGTIVGAIFGIYGIYMLVVLGFLKGTAGANNYGPDPLQG
jgi:uncharacterized membrane protein YhaH (DUF805 family)